MNVCLAVVGVLFLVALPPLFFWTQIVCTIYMGLTLVASLVLIYICVDVGWTVDVWWNPVLRLIFSFSAFTVSTVALHGVGEVAWIGMILMIDVVWIVEALLRERPFQEKAKFDFINI